jgi:hypothetical protein
MSESALVFNVVENLASVPDLHVLELRNEVNAMRREIEKVNLETWCFERYHDKIQSQVQAKEEELKKKNTNKKEKKLVYKDELNGTQKYEIGSYVQDTMNTEIEEGRDHGEKLLETLRAVLEETECRIRDMKRDAFLFKRDVVVGGENPRTKAIMSEKIEAYYAEKERLGDIEIVKLRLNNKTLKHKMTKVEHDLRLRDEAGDVLHYIDFHQLQIENKQFVRKISEREYELGMSKNMTGKCVKELNHAKSELNSAQSLLKSLVEECSEKRTQIQQLDEEGRFMQKYIKQCKRSSAEIKRVLDCDVEVPEADVYIAQRREMYAVQSQLKTWEKRVELNTMAAKSSKHRAKRAALSDKTNIRRSVTR